MRTQILCFKVPMSAKQAYVGHHFVHKKTVASYNNYAPDIYRYKETRKDAEIYHITPSRYPNAVMQKYLPECMNLIEKATTKKFPLVTTEFRLLSVLEMGGAKSIFHFSDEPCEPYPKTFNGHFKGNPSIKCIDLTEDEEDQQVSYIYNLISFNFQLSLILSPIVNPIFVNEMKVFSKTFHDRLIDETKNFANLTIEQVDAVKFADFYKIQQINESEPSEESDEETDEEEQPAPALPAKPVIKPKRVRKPLFQKKSKQVKIIK